MDGGHTRDIIHSLGQTVSIVGALVSDYPFCIHTFLVLDTIYSTIFVELPLEVHLTGNKSRIGPSLSPNPEVVTEFILKGI